MMQNVRQIRDEKRPEMATVVETLDRVLSVGFKLQQVSQGPDSWSWVDLSQAHLGFEKWFVLSTSTMEGIEGYPLLTIRQSTAPRLDAWVTVSQLVVGPDEASIQTSLAMAIANLNGAYLGIREVISGVVQSYSESPEQVLESLAQKKEMN